MDRVKHGAEKVPRGGSGGGKGRICYGGLGEVGGRKKKWSSSKSESSVEAFADERLVRGD